MNKPTKQSYSLLIRRNDTFLDFESLDALKAELGRYFTDREKASGIVERLTSPMMKNECRGYWTGSTSYQDMSITCNVFYPSFFDSSIEDKLSPKVVPLHDLIDVKKAPLTEQILDSAGKAGNSRKDVSVSRRRPDGR